MRIAFFASTELDETATAAIAETIRRYTGETLNIGMCGNAQNPIIAREIRKMQEQEAKPTTQLIVTSGTGSGVHPWEINWQNECLIRFADEIILFTNGMERDPELRNILIMTLEQGIPITRIYC